jgi:thiosulfate dehydrogenase [quinone] large subunit
MSLRENFQQPTYLGYLALARIAVGYHFVTAALPKIQRGYGGEALARRLVEGAADDKFGWHRDFILNWVVPNADWFSQLVAYGELAIGISLVTGCLVRVASAFGAFHNLNIYLAVAGDGAEFGIGRIYVLLHIIFIITSAGRSLGVDGWLHRKFPRSPVF